jgi:hypothetical protein
MTVYVCTKDACPNKDVVYNFDDARNGVECGGCKEWLEPNE